MIVRKKVAVCACVCEGERDIPAFASGIYMLLITRMHVIQMIKMSVRYEREQNSPKNECKKRPLSGSEELMQPIRGIGKGSLKGNQEE